MPKYIFLIFLIEAFFFGMSASLAASAKTNGNEYFHNEFPKIVCLDDDYLMSCFKMKKSVCEFQVNELVDLCFEKMPRKAETRNKHIVLGACIGDLFEKKNLSVKSDSSQCMHPEKWK